MLQQFQVCSQTKTNKSIFYRILIYELSQNWQKEHTCSIWNQKLHSGEQEIPAQYCCIRSLIPRPFPPSVLDHWQYANTAAASDQMLAMGMTWDEATASAPLVVEGILEACIASFPGLLHLAFFDAVINQKPACGVEGLGARLARYLGL